MPMKTRSQCRKEQAIVDTVEIKVNDYEMDDEVSRLNKILCKQGREFKIALYAACVSLI